ncbi:MAG: MBL fold metallo-hydrolase [Chloroflexaceae bacterium]|nr:MBL fold metallo-hydrolase [Chloroflexaceae bacterium]
MEIVPIDTHLTAIDHDLMAVPGVGATYVVQGEAVALVETGTSLTVAATLAGLDELGIARDAVGHILCTHIHMDHAGGAGYLAVNLPRARVYIHRESIPHLADPSKLMPSARRAVGEAAWPLTGDMLPVPLERLHPAEDLRLDLGRGVCLEALPTPGHSPDHVSFWDRRSGGMFLGDAAGLSMPRHGLDFPVTPVPTYDLETHRATIEMLRKQDIGRLYLTHYGVHDDTDDKLRLALEQIEGLAEMVRAVLADGGAEAVDVAALAARYVPYPDDGPAALVARSWSQMSVAGMLRYLKKRQ